MADLNHRITIEDRVAVLHLERPPANALSIEFLDELDVAISALESDDSWRSLVLSGYEGIFSAGADLKLLPTFDVAHQDIFVTGLNRLYARLYGVSRPTIAAINGHAIAGGLFLALCCDYRIASTVPASFGLTEVRVGVAFPIAPLEIARAELSPPVCRRFLLFGENVDTETALRDGVIDELAAPDKVLARAIERARGFHDIPADAFAKVKAQLRAEPLVRMRDALEYGTEPALGGWIPEADRQSALRVLAGKAGA